MERKRKRGHTQGTQTSEMNYSDLDYKFTSGAKSFEFREVKRRRETK